VPRFCSPGIAAPLFAGAMLAALVGGAWAQTTSVPPAGLRLTLDENGPDGQRPAWVRPSRRPAVPVGVVPKFGTPAGAGAGKTGFISTNASARKQARPRPGARGTSTVRTTSPTAPGAVGPTAAGRGQPDAANDAPLAQPPASTAAPATAPPPPNDTGPTGSLAANTAAAAAARNGDNGPRMLLMRRRVPVEGDPFDAVGIRAGSFVLRPAIEIGTGYDTNPARTANGRGSPQLLVAPELLARSDWERHALDVAIRGSYSYYPDVPVSDRPNLDARATGRVDVNRDTHIDLQGRYIISTDYPGSPNIAADIARMPIYTDVGGTVGVVQKFNRLEVSVKGLVDRIDWHDSLLTNGSHSSNADRDYDQYATQARVSYELTPGIKPFAEVDIDRRVHDILVDRNGNMRDSDGLIAKAGTTFELTRTLTGEIAAGYIERVYKDPTLPDIRAPLFDASLAWAATALTTIKLVSTTTVDESVLPGVSGVLRHNTALEISHELRRWLLATVKLAEGIDQYVGSTREDHRYLASVAVTYKLSRSLQLKGELRQEWLHSNVAGADYSATIALIGLRLQR